MIKCCLCCCGPISESLRLYTLLDLNEEDTLVWSLFYTGISLIFLCIELRDKG